MSLGTELLPHMKWPYITDLLYWGLLLGQSSVQPQLLHVSCQHMLHAPFDPGLSGRCAHN